MKSNAEILAKGMAQFAWDSAVEETELDKLNLSQDILSLVRVYFSIAYYKAQSDTLDVLKDVYNNDLGALEMILESDNNDLVH